MRRFLWLCIRAELILLSLAIYWHHYIPRLVPYAKPQPSEASAYSLGSSVQPGYAWNHLNSRSTGHSYYIQNWQGAIGYQKGAPCSIATPCSMQMVFLGNKVEAP